MKAVVSERYGPPEVQKITEVKKPSPKDNEVLIKIYATTVNRTDTGLRSANYFISRFFTGLLWPKHKIFGSEFAGKIEAVGKDIKEFKIGERVFGFNDIEGGAHAEYKTASEYGSITTIPEKLSYADAAPILEGATYALNNIRAAKVKKSQNVLIYGASGGIGSAALQIVKYLGVNVTAVCGSKNVSLVKSLGADRVIDYQKEDFTKLNQKFDFIFDAVGKTSYGKCNKLLKTNGIYCSTELGRFGQNPILAVWFAITGSRKVIFPIPKITKEKAIYLKKLVESGEYKPVIDRKYRLDEIVEATKYVESGQKIGNVVIKVL